MCVFLHMHIYMYEGSTGCALTRLNYIDYSLPRESLMPFNSSICIFERVPISECKMIKWLASTKCSLITLQ